MGSVISYLLSFILPQPDPTPDPATGLTQRERDIITQTWSVIADKKTIKVNAVEFFVELFETFPYMLDYFPSFQGVSELDLRKSNKLRAHAATVFYTISAYVDNLDDVDTLVSLVKKIAVSHIQRGLTVQEFEDLKTVFLKFVKNQFGSQCTPEVESAWNKLLTVHNSVYQATTEEQDSKEVSEKTETNATDDLLIANNLETRGDLAAE